MRSCAAEGLVCSTGCSSPMTTAEMRRAAHTALSAGGAVAAEMKLGGSLGLQLAAAATGDD
jgi:hypothetical protein